MTIDSTTLQDDLRRIIREEVRPIIREETQDMRGDITQLKDMIGAQGMQLSSVQSDISVIKNTLRYHGSEMHRLDVLLDDMNDRFSAARELRWD